MVGQGRPFQRRFDFAHCVSHIVVWLTCCALLPSQPTSAEEVSLQARISWGGGVAQVWQGSIALASGKLEKKHNLGIEADSPAAVIAKNEWELQVLPRSPHAYNGVDVQLLGDATAQLRVQLQSSNDTAPVLLECTLAELLAGQKTIKLDDRGNRLGIQRVPNDGLRYSSESNKSIFNTSDVWTCRIQPRFVTEAANQDGVLSVEVRELSSGVVVWQQEKQVELNTQGNCDGTIEVQAPLKSEGVYELTAELRSRPFVSALVRPKVWCTRKIQCVALAPQLTKSSPSDWKMVDEFDPAEPKSEERALRMPSWKRLANTALSPLGSGPLGTTEALGKSWTTLASSGWQAYPVTIQNLHLPHIVEVEYPADMPQSMGLSIIEPNSAGKVMPLGLDSGWEVSAAAPGENPAIEKHRLVFWPRTKAPLLLFTNNNSEGVAVFGKVRMFAGPTTLPTTLLPASMGTTASNRQAKRWLCGYFEKPFFPENFSAAEAYDVKSGRSFEDWQTFYSGSKRLAEYLRYAGLNAAVIPAHSEGSTLYPSTLFDASPKHDSAVFTEVYSDPQRKDVLELLCREFDRYELKLVPSLTFSSPLPELEGLKSQGTSAEITGIELIGNDGRTWAQTTGTRGGEAPFYNLLDQRVQDAMRRAVMDLTRRYRNHTSLGGVAIQLTTDSYAQLPDETWGCDAATVALFVREQKLQMPPFSPEETASRWQWIEQHALEQWITWRAQRITTFYEQVRDDLVSMRADLRLVLCPTQPFSSQRLETRLQPHMPIKEQFQSSLLATGIDAERLSQLPGVVWSRVQRATPAYHRAEDPNLLLANRSQQLDATLRQSAIPAGFSLRSAIPQPLEAFDKVSPFGAQNTKTYLLLHPSPANHSARKPWIELLATADMHVLGVGGAMLPLGQEEAVRPLLQTLTQLPATKFETVAPPANCRTQPVVARTWSGQGHSWYYFVNDSPWSANVNMDFQSSEPLEIQLVGSAASPSQHTPQHGVVHWQTPIAPYACVAIRINRAQVTLANWQTQVDSAVELSLREQTRELRLRANTLRSPEPLDSLLNAGFETHALVGAIPDWNHAKTPGVAVTFDRQEPHGGNYSLHLASHHVGTQPAPAAWVRSTPIPTPATGRLALWVWLRTSDESRQPKLRLALEGKYEGKTYYRRANVGHSEDQHPVQQLRTKWTPFLFPLDDLPSEGLTDLQIGFDLMGEGEVWIDDIQLYDLWFQDNERDALLKEIAVAEVQLQAGQLRDCEKFLNSDWSRFLLTHVSLPTTHVAQRTLPAVDSAIPSKDSAVSPAAKKPGMFERMKQWSPRMPFQKN
jgi:Glycosyl hydrolase-like 10